MHRTAKRVISLLDITNLHQGLSSFLGNEVVERTYYSLVPFRVLNACALICGVPRRSPPFSLISRGTKCWRVGKEGTEPGGKGIDRTDRTEGTKWGMNHLKSGEKRRVRKVNELGKKGKKE